MPYGICTTNTSCMNLKCVQTNMLPVVVDLCNEEVHTWVGKVKLQQALVLLSEARFML
jgi:hypothetical protein